MQQQTTIAREVEQSGIGLHSGLKCTVKLLPSEANTGVRFRRTDLNPPIEIEASPRNAVAAARNTTLEYHGERISTIEHLMSALAGCGIDNVTVEVDSCEMPILDGSAKPWVELLNVAGVVELAARQRTYTIEEPITYKGSSVGIEYIALPYDGFKVTTIIDFDNKAIGKQVAEYDDTEDYLSTVGRCRTFVSLHEIVPLLENNLIKGGALDNALVFADRELSPEHAAKLAAIFNRSVSDIKVENGVVNTCKPFFVNEPARHKLLDFIGDISLLGVHLKGHFIVRCPGHKENAAFAKYLSYQIERKAQEAVVPTCLNGDTKLDVKAIQRFLPHRYPLLMVDKIVELTDNYVVGVKNITINEAVFIGHFPGNPVFPGVLQLESMAQTGGFMVTYLIENPEDYGTVLTRIDKVKFRRQAVPGDTLVLKVFKEEPLRHGFFKMRGLAYVGETLITEAYLTAQIYKKDNK